MSQINPKYEKVSKVWMPDVIEWIRNCPGDYAFQLNEVCYRCRQKKLIVELTPTDRWVCGECWSRYFPSSELIEQ